MLMILRIDIEVLVVTFISIKYGKPVEMIWSKWYQVTSWDVEFISQISLTVSPSKMSPGLTVKFVSSGKAKSIVLHYCHFSSRLYGVIHHVRTLGASQPICIQHQFQGTTSDTIYAIFPEHILLLSLSTEDPRRFYAESCEYYHHHYFLSRETRRTINRVKVICWATWLGNQIITCCPSAAWKLCQGNQRDLFSCKMQDVFLFCLKNWEVLAAWYAKSCLSSGGALKGFPSLSHGETASGVAGRTWFCMHIHLM